MIYNPRQYWEVRGYTYVAPDDKSEELQNLQNCIMQFCDNADILEVGSGYGKIYQFLTDYCKIDPSRIDFCDFVHSMRYKCKELTGRFPDYWDGQRFPYKNNDFSLVISFDVFLHVPLDNIDDFFKEHIRVCNGYIFIATYTGTANNLAPHCFRHDYIKLFRENNMNIIHEALFRNGIRTNWLLRKKKIIS